MHFTTILVVPEDSKPVSDSLLTYHKQGMMTFIRCHFQKKIHQQSIIKISLTIINQRIPFKSLRGNELIFKDDLYKI